MPVQSESDWRDHIVKLIKSVSLSSHHSAWYRHVLMLQPRGYLQVFIGPGGGRGGRAVCNNHKRFNAAEPCNHFQQSFFVVSIYHIEIH